jgi:hypothetical protein
LRSKTAAQRTGVQRPATVLTESDPANTVCRQVATKGNGTELLLVRCSACWVADAWRSANRGFICTAIGVRTWHALRVCGRFDRKVYDSTISGFVLWMKATTSELSR